jgi:hypothetical protein
MSLVVKRGNRRYEIEERGWGYSNCKEVAQSQGTRPQPSSALSLEEIRHVAYDIHIERGGTHGQNMDDWAPGGTRARGKVSGGLVVLGLSYLGN